MIDIVSRSSTTVVIIDVSAIIYVTTCRKCNFHNYFSLNSTSRMILNTKRMPITGATILIICVAVCQKISTTTSVTLMVLFYHKNRGMHPLFLLKVRLEACVTSRYTLDELLQHPVRKCEEYHDRHNSCRRCDCCPEVSRRDSVRSCESSDEPCHVTCKCWCWCHFLISRFCFQYYSNSLRRTLQYQFLPARTMIRDLDRTLS